MNESSTKRKPRAGKTPTAKIIWTPAEDEELRRLVDVYGDQSWHRLCKMMPNKTELRCFKRWKQLKRLENPDADVESECSEKKPPQIQNSTQWSKEEDRILKDKVE